MPFLFHYIETSFATGSTFAFIGTLIFVILAGLISIRSNLYYIFLVNVLTILLSVALGRKFIIPPNESWFNPFGMDVMMIWTGTIIFIGVMIVRFISSTLLLKNEK